ncbi:hypothetical protein AMTRI_Chr10g3330 [Amborella trichopoda]
MHGIFGVFHRLLRGLRLARWSVCILESFFTDPSRGSMHFLCFF